MATTLITYTVSLSGTLTTDTTDVREKLYSADATGFNANNCRSERGSIANGVTKSLFPSSLATLGQDVEFMIRFTYPDAVALASREVAVNPDGIAAAIIARKFFAGKAETSLTVLNSTGSTIDYEVFTFVETA